MNKKASKVLTEMGQHVLPDGRTAMVHLCVTIWKNAIAGDKTFTKILLDRLEGRPPVGELEPAVPETDSLIAEALLRVYGPVTEAEAQAVKADVFEMAKNAEQARDL